MVPAAGPKTRLGAVSVLVVAFVVGLLLAGCGSNPEDTLRVDEGEPMKLGELVYNVQISRFLNPNDDEDKAYLAGQSPPPKNKFYLGVFMQVSNDANTAEPVPTDFTVEDTVGTRFKPVPSDSLFALDLGGKVPPDGQLPKPETTAANGPIQGSMVLFLVDRSALEDRPLVLHIPAPSGPAGRVELDI
jgi:hypothetical protein